MQLIFEENVPNIYGSSFIDSVIDYSNALAIDPNWLMAIMNFETAGTFSSSIRNPYTNATGLIQFMPSTALGLNTTVDELALLSAEEQLYYVYLYFLPYKDRLKSYLDMYLATFFPAAIGKPSTYVLQTSRLSASSIASVNPVFDLNKDERITVGEIEKVILEKIPQAWRNYFGGGGYFESDYQKKSSIPSLVGVSLLGYLAYKLLV